MLETAILLREPLAIDYFSRKKSALEIFSEIIMSTAMTVPALVGEVFTEEQREISGVYEGILRAVADGKGVSTEISDYLFSRRLIRKNDPSAVQQYLNNLISFGIIKRIPVYGRKRFSYRHASPLLKLFYYSDEKYNISERSLSEKEIKEIISVLMPRLIEDNIREFYAEALGLGESIIEAKDHEIDACLLKFRKPQAVMEVKWKSLKNDDILKAEENLRRYRVRKILFVPEKEKAESSSLEVNDPSDLLETAGKAEL